MSRKMMPIGPLMIEHRVIERMIVALRAELRDIEQTGTVDVDFLTSAVDFLRRYADQCHHGKEELILFRELRRKPLPPHHAATLAELIDEHVTGRAAVARLVAAIDGYRRDGAAQATLDLHRGSSEYSGGSLYIGATGTWAKNTQGVAPHVGYRLFPYGLGGHWSFSLETGAAFWDRDGLPGFYWSIGLDRFL